ncbi:hypothetical protein BpHYR1_021749 [Brachionus plicatilis]|uniref:Uncharacterized protein n=1 Tax=Brachionus plicatilis TaxID=10195 RepID=A0A3M7T1Y0_BRAPC|nr:hypothetical protein BpHYR1_021749 [Brachionus plicatilis]
MREVCLDNFEIKILLKDESYLVNGNNSSVAIHMSSISVFPIELIRYEGSGLKAFWVEDRSFQYSCLMGAVRFVPFLLHYLHLQDRKVLEGHRLQLTHVIRIKAKKASLLLIRDCDVCFESKYCSWSY